MFQKDGTVKNIIDILFPYGDIAVAELVDVQLNDLGPVIQMYQFIGDINDEGVPGLESILNYINENLNKTDPAVNGHSYYITKAFNTQCNEEHYYNKQYITNNVNNHIIKKTLYNNAQVLNIRKEYSPKIYNSTNYRTQIDYIENNIYKKSDNRTFNSTNNI